MGFSASFLFAVLVLACEGHLQQLRGEQRSVASFRGHGMSCLLCRSDSAADKIRISAGQPVADQGSLWTQTMGRDTSLLWV
ncbi:hypothetical protein AMECASPLE_023770 [Ameca splendens]|uniref:Uncharacterized protein n=1 Tax=Ameca splendens TaxID=208324 RepID=A0ABV0XTC8_9TELE